MSARQMNVHYICITYFRVTEIEVVMIPPPELVAVNILSRVAYISYHIS